MDRAAIARFGLNVTDVRPVVEIAMAGKSGGGVFEGWGRFRLVVRLPVTREACAPAPRVWW